ncbi:NAD(P)/FAD-dependent oxidoreductase [Marinobacteraceae bacterium S3BR75-40.1]
MDTQEASYDVAIVGAGIAGCTAALLYARAGLKVALLERAASLDDYKPLCTHYLQPGAVPVLRELSLYEAVLAEGGLHSSMHIRSPWGAFTVPHGRGDRGLNVRRSLLDPLLHRAVQRQSGVDLMLGVRPAELVRQGSGIGGVVARNDQGDSLTLHARLVVAADGRSSSMVRLADLETRETRNERFSFFSYYRGLHRYPDNNVQVWLADGGQSYVAAFPNDRDLTLVSCYVPLSRYDQWRGRAQQRYEEMVARQPEGPDLSEGVQVTPLRGMRRMPSLVRRNRLPGLALVGDAAMAVDPLAGVGCAWAFQSAQLLARSTAPVLARDAGRARLAQALRVYRWRHALQFGPQYFAITRFSLAKPYNPLTRLTLRLAGGLFRDPGAMESLSVASSPRA